MSIPTLAPVSLPPIHRHTLANGLQVLVAPRHDLPLVAIELLVGGGSSLDPLGQKGRASLAASLLTRGSEARVPGEANRVLEGVGGRWDARASRDHLLVSAASMSEDLELALEILGEAVLHPLFDPREFETARARAVAELEQSKDDPPTLASRALLGALLPEAHPYAAPVLGKVRDLEALDREALRAAYAAEVGADRATLIVVGDVVPEQVRDLAERIFGSWGGAPVAASGAGPTVVGQEPGARRKIRIISKEEASQVQVRFVGAAPLRHLDPVYFPAMVANGAFGGGFTSRLVDEIRVRRGLSYSVGSGFLLLREAGYFTFSSFTKNESIGELLEVALREGEKAREQGFSDEEVERARRYLAGIYPLHLETNGQIAHAIAEMEEFGLPDSWVPTYRSNLIGVGRDEAHHAARSLFFSGAEAWVLVGNQDAIVAALEAQGIEGEVEILPLDAAI